MGGEQEEEDGAGEIRRGEKKKKDFYALSLKIKVVVCVTLNAHSLSSIIIAVS